MINSNYFSNAIVLTGGIATGKTTTANILKSYNIKIIDADKITHILLDKYSTNISELFGDEFVKDNKVLRKKLGNLIFNDKIQKKKLEIFIHPLISQEILNQAKTLHKTQKFYIVDIPLFFETKKYKIDKSIVVYIPKTLQLQRLMARDKSDKPSALSRIHSQLDIEAKRKLATYIIDNSKDIKYLQLQIQNILKDLL
jgi:dephospho-CoA kinase